MACRGGIIPFLTGIDSVASPMTAFSSPSKRAIRALAKRKRTTCWSKPAGCTSPSCTRRIEMLRGFLLVFVLASIVIVAIAGFRGEHSPRTPWEIFPDMVRQQKVRAQSPIDFFGDGRGPRLPIANTVPIGYDIPKPQQKTLPGVQPTVTVSRPEPTSNRIGFSVGTDYYNTGKMGNNWGTGIPVPVTEQLMQRGQQRFNINCSPCHGGTAAGNGIVKQYGL